MQSSPVFYWPLEKPATRRRLCCTRAPFSGEPAAGRAVLETMKTFFHVRFSASSLVLVLGLAAVTSGLTGCYGPSSGHVSVATSGVIGEDDYVYYPNSEVYYSPSHRYYYYR